MWLALIWVRIFGRSGVRFRENSRDCEKRRLANKGIKSHDIALFLIGELLLCQRSLSGEAAFTFGRNGVRFQEKQRSLSGELNAFKDFYINRLDVSDSYDFKDFNHTCMCGFDIEEPEHACHRELH
jgi:hypothetical protein